MALNVPTFSQLLNRIGSAINSNVTGATAFVSRSIFNVWAKIIAALQLDIYSYISALVTDYFISTASLEGLIRRGTELGVPRKLATYASGQVVFNGTTGIFIPAGTALNMPNGQTYTTLSDALVNSAGQAYADVQADNTGTAGNAAGNSEISLVSPINGIVSAASVGPNGLTGGADIETTEEYRARLLKFIQDQPGAGDPTFYENAALTRPGVTRAKCFRIYNGPGTVGLSFMMDNTYPNGIPSPGDVAAMQSFLESIMPADVAELIVFAPVAHTVDIEISDLFPDNITIRNNITDALTIGFRTNYNWGDTVYVSQISGIISAIPNEIRHDLTQPISDILVPFDEIAVLGEITFVATK